MYSVIIVEDENIIRNGIKNSINWKKHNCIVIGEAKNGLDGVELILSLKPNIVITDINMPVVNGLSMIEQTKPNCNYSAIVLTGYSDFNYACEAIRAGVVDYILKPLKNQDMDEAIGRAITDYNNICLLKKKNKETRNLKKLSLFEGIDLSNINDELVKGTLDYIYVNFRNKITMTDLSEALYYSDRYINQRFQKITGTTVIEFLNRYRIQQALILLQNTNKTICDIGELIGIGDYKYFNLVFKKYIGCSPREYREKIAL